MRLLVAVVVGAVGMVGVGRALAASVLDAIEVVEQPATVRLHVSGPVVVEAHRLPPNGQATDRIYVDLRQGRVAEDSQRPPVAEDVYGAGHRTRHGLSRGLS